MKQYPLLFALLTTGVQVKAETPPPRPATTPTAVTQILNKLDDDINKARRYAVDDLERAKRSDPEATRNADRALLYTSEIENIKNQMARTETIRSLCSSFWAAATDDKWDLRRDGSLVNLNHGWAGRKWMLSEDNQELTFSFANGQLLLYRVVGGKLVDNRPDWKYTATQKP
jgi:hypothetical protein